MAVRDLIIDLASIDLDNVIADINEIHKYIPQRYEMEQLTAIVYIDPESAICVGYRDVSRNEFWVRGHMPGTPLMPGVIMCEAAAQLCTYYAQRYQHMKDRVLGLGGLEEVRFRAPVVPGDRLILVAKGIKVRPGRMVTSHFQGFVADSQADNGFTMVVEGILKGIALPGTTNNNQAVSSST